MERAGALVRPIRLLLVDDHEVILDGLTAMLDAYSDQVRVVSVAHDGAEALDAASTPPPLDPTVVLLDVRLRSESGLDVGRSLLERRPELLVVFFTVYDDEHYLFQALRAGAAGYLLKQARGEELVAQLQRVAAGEIVIDPGLAGRVALAAARLTTGEFWSGAHLGLTQRESEVLGLMVQGCPNRAIAKRLLLGEETIKTHVGAIYRKLEVSDRAQAVARALREGLFA
jgi:DNA-binding NarL/FixJ family response regulator